MKERVILLNEQEIPMTDVEWGRTKILVGKGGKAESDDFMLKITEYMPSHAHKWHSHPQQEEVIFVLSGRGITELADGKKEIGPGDVVFVPADVRHATYNPYEEPLRAVIIKSPPDKQVGQ